MKKNNLYSDYELYQILEANGYKTHNKNLQTLKEGLESGKYELITEAPVGLDTGEYVDRKNVYITKHSDDGSYTGTRIENGKPAEEVSGHDDPVKDAEMAGETYKKVKAKQKEEKIEDQVRMSRFLRR